MNFSSLMLSLARRVIDRFQFLIRSPEGYARWLGVAIGRDCSIYTKSGWGSEPFLISMGDSVTITSGVKLLTHDGASRLVKSSDGSRYQRFAPINIGDNVFVGVNSIVMPGVTVGSKVIIGAGSVVTVNVPDNSVFAGNPARYIKSFDEYEKDCKQRGVCEESLSEAKDYREKIARYFELRKLEDLGQ